MSEAQPNPTDKLVESLEARESALELQIAEFTARLEEVRDMIGLVRPARRRHRRVRVVESLQPLQPTLPEAANEEQQQPPPEAA